MGKLAETKNEIQDLKNNKRGVTEHIENLARRRQEIEEKLSIVNQELAKANSELESARAQYIMGEVDDLVLESLQSRVSGLEVKIKSQSGVLKVLDDNISSIKQKEGELAGQLKDKFHLAWREILKVELAKAAVGARRALVAYGNVENIPMEKVLTLQCRQFLEQTFWEAMVYGEHEGYKDIEAVLIGEYLSD